MTDEVKIVYAEMLRKGPEHTPFAAMPAWLKTAILDGKVELSTRGARDYAVLDVQTATGTEEAQPGDFISHDSQGRLFVRRGPHHR